MGGDEHRKPPWPIGNANARVWLTVFIVVVMAILVGMVLMLDFTELEMFLPLPSK